MVLSVTVQQLEGADDLPLEPLGKQFVYVILGMGTAEVLPSDGLPRVLEMPLQLAKTQNRVGKQLLEGFAELTIPYRNEDTILLQATPISLAVDDHGSPFG